MNIFKYILMPRREQLLFLPAGSRILEVGFQANPAAKPTEVDHELAPPYVPVLWAEVPDNEYKVQLPVNVLSIATGGHLTAEEQSTFTYVDTLQIPGRNVVEAVFHVYVAPVAVAPVTVFVGANAATRIG